MGGFSQSFHILSIYLGHVANFVETEQLLQLEPGPGDEAPTIASYVEVCVCPGGESGGGGRGDRRRNFSYNANACPMIGPFPFVVYLKWHSILRTP